MSLGRMLSLTGLAGLVTLAGVNAGTHTDEVQSSMFGHLKPVPFSPLACVSPSSENKYCGAYGARDWKTTKNIDIIPAGSVLRNISVECSYTDRAVRGFSTSGQANLPTVREHYSDRLRSYESLIPPQPLVVAGLQIYGEITDVNSGSYRYSCDDSVYTIQLTQPLTVSGKTYSTDEKIKLDTRGDQMKVYAYNEGLPDLCGVCECVDEDDAYDYSYGYGWD